MVLYGAVEMGGTKTDWAVGSSYEDMSDPQRIETSDPETTLGRITDALAEHDIAAVGVASFGPLDLDRASMSYGSLLTTPKPGWTGAAVRQRLVETLGVPVTIDTDVNGSALGEGRWGAAKGMDNYVYVTVGTGIGAGIIVNGKTITGKQHPEMGHITVNRLEGDRRTGSCPYHGDCLEGMASGPALESRFGRPESWASNDQITTLATHYVAQGMLNLVYTVAPERIIVGGGVTQLPGFHDRLRNRLGQLIAGYPSEPDLDLLISPPGLGDRSGLAGAIVLAAEASAESQWAR